MLAHGQGFRTAVLTATRGTGGQNEIGPELFEALSVLQNRGTRRGPPLRRRRAVLRARHRLRLLVQRRRDVPQVGPPGDPRRLRPDDPHDPPGRHRHHVAGRRAGRRAPPGAGAHHRRGVPAGRRPEELPGATEGWSAALAGAQAVLPGWIRRPRRPAFACGCGEPRRMVRVATDVYDPLLGQTYAEMGSLARSSHKCQGMGQLLALPGGGGGGSYRLGDTTLPGGAGGAETTLFDGIDTSIAGLAAFAKTPAPDALKAGLAAIAAQADSAQKAFKSQGPEAARGPIVAGLGAVRALRARLGSMGLDEDGAVRDRRAPEAQGRPVPARGRPGAGPPHRRPGGRRRGVRRTAAARADDRGQSGIGRHRREERSGSPGSTATRPAPPPSSRPAP